jgi:hypothetical protein
MTPRLLRDAEKAKKLRNIGVKNMMMERMEGNFYGKR